MTTWDWMAILLGFVSMGAVIGILAGTIVGGALLGAILYVPTRWYFRSKKV